LCPCLAFFNASSLFSIPSFFFFATIVKMKVNNLRSTSGNVMNTLFSLDYNN
jgi:hypothetical protein